MAVIAIKLPNELIDQIDEWGAERGMTRSESIRRWIKNGVDERWRPLKQKSARAPKHEPRLLPWQPRPLIVIPTDLLRQKSKPAGSVGC